MPDFVIHRDTAELDGTGYVEVGRGRYSGKHWVHGFIFLAEDAFGLAEGILAQRFPEYDHYGMNDVPRSTGIDVVANWRSVATQLATLSPAEAQAALHLERTYRDGLERHIDQHRAEVAQFLRALADEVEGFCSDSEWFCVLGL